jgi:hypothetical protein
MGSDVSAGDLGSGLGGDEGYLGGAAGDIEEESTGGTDKRW